ncbi:hypothetical protein [Methanothermococcus okinawensis]|uniref:Uncharacterized protein n=1 Tax=Methanothermococcus okinawensis (strain DSM 14208 / JCM 11175 / IH1) TaxID=647113 RepID=F8ANT6_METOI|nr:hypothetical protein [Methanothermococcus okinawensis]AEH06289.1 hypothetical protein Metok_0299 [Methanothermococcus okinawensis IH1]
MTEKYWKYTRPDGTVGYHKGKKWRGISQQEVTKEEYADLLRVIRGLSKLAATHPEIEYLRIELAKELLSEKWSRFEKFCRRVFYGDVKVTKEEWDWAWEVREQLHFGPYTCGLIAKELQKEVKT